MKTSRVVTSLFASLATALLFVSLLSIAAHGQAAAHVMENAAAAKWGPAPPMLPPGAQIAVLAGDPTRAGRYTVRFRFPANYNIPAHSHPEDENVAVVSGELFMQMGTKLDRTSGMGIAAGGFALMPAGAPHAAYTKSETTILLYGQGPVEFNYVNRSDDPRTSSAAPGKRNSAPRPANWASGKSTSSAIRTGRSTRWTPVPPSRRSSRTFAGAGRRS